MSQEKFVVFHVEGGLGKNVASTAIIKNIAEKYKDRKLIVVASFPEIFLNNPHIYRVYKLGMNPYFWQDYIKDKDTIVMRREPYFESAHIMQETPLHETWHKMYDIPYNKDKDLPELYMNMIQLELPFNWSRPKPIMLLHTNGGPLVDGAPVYAWSRDMPKYLIEAIINNFANQYHIIQVCKHELQAIKSPAVEVLFKPMSNFELFALVRASAKRVLIDSCLQHAAAAYRLPSTVLWIGTKPEMFGYKLHTNIRSKAPLGNVKNIESLYFDYQLDGFFHECPYNSPDEMFDVQEVLRTISRV